MGADMDTHTRPHLCSGIGDGLSDSSDGHGDGGGGRPLGRGRGDGSVGAAGSHDDGRLGDLAP